MSPPEAPRWRRRGRPAQPAPRAVKVARVRSVPPPVVVSPNRRVPLSVRALGWAALLGALASGLWLASTHVDDSAFARQLGAGCDDQEPCQRLEAEAERRLDGCLIFCGRAATQYETARLLRYRSEERRAIREHYRERERTERIEQESARARKLDDRQRRDAARVEQAEREHRERLELEQLRQAHIDRRLAEERQRRASYYAALGQKGRALRLEHCLETNERCDALVLDLLDAAKNDAERRTLAELNERVPPPPAPKTRIAAGSQRPADAASNAAAEPGAAEKIPAKEAESGLITPSPVHPTS